MRRITLTLFTIAVALFVLPLALMAQTLPELPRSVPDVTIPTTTRTIRVPAGDATALQAALDTARGGDAIVLANGGRWVGNFRLGSHTGVVVLRSDSVPPLARVDTAARLATLTTPNTDAAITATGGASGWRIVGVRVTLDLAPGVINYGMVKLGVGDERTLEAMPRDIVLDRVIVDAGAERWTSRCVALNGIAQAVIRSQLRNCHLQGFDSQGILGWNGPGPFLVQDNTIEGAGQAIMFGGADPAIRGVVPSDITIRGNDLSKPLTWAGKWTVKATFELKDARRVLFESNVLTNHWTDAQVGYAILLQPVNQGGTAPWCTVADVTIRDNVVRRSTSGINMLARFDTSVAPLARVLVERTRYDSVGTDPVSGVSGRLVQLLNEHADVTLRDNIFASFGASTAILLDGIPATRLRIERNTFGRTEYGVFGSGVGEGMAALAKLAPDAVVSGNAFTGRPSWIYPADNSFPAAPTTEPPAPPVKPDPVPPVVAPSLETAPVGFAIASGSGARTQLRTERIVCRDGTTVRGVVTLASPSRYHVHVVRGAAWVTLRPTFTSRAAAINACYTP